MGKRIGDERTECGQIDMTLSKANIIKDLVRLGFSKTSAARLFETIQESIKSSLENGEDVLISGFGKFCVNDKGRRKGKNPTTGKDMILDRRRAVTFKCSKVLKDKLNQTWSH